VRICPAGPAPYAGGGYFVTGIPLRLAISAIARWGLWVCCGLRGGFGCGLSGQPLVEGNGEGKELLLAVEGVDHFDVELGAFERRIVEAADVIEEVAGEGAVGVDDGAGEAEVGVVFLQFLIELAVDGDGRQGQGQRDLGSGGAFEGEEDAANIVGGSGGDDVVVDGDELDARVIEGERGVAVVGEDDPDGQEAVLDVGNAEEVAFFGVVAGLGGDGKVLVRVDVKGSVLSGGFDGRSFFVGGVGVGRKEAGCDQEKKSDSE